MQDKAGNFQAKELEDSINGKFEEASGEMLAEGVSIRAESSCRRDLLKWGAKYEINKKRPYFHGHERPDVIEYRNEFVKKFDITKKSFGFLQKFIDEESYLEPSIVRIENEKRCVVTCHDESTFRSGESAPSRWVWNNEYTFFNKGYGQSLMVSDFLVLDSEPYFELNESEYKLALKKYPDLNNDTFYKKIPYFYIYFQKKNKKTISSVILSRKFVVKCTLIQLVNKIRLHYLNLGFIRQS
jgi:hypothetical protein